MGNKWKTIKVSKYDSGDDILMYLIEGVMYITYEGNLIRLVTEEREKEYKNEKALKKIREQYFY